MRSSIVDYTRAFSHAAKMGWLFLTIWIAVGAANTMVAHDGAVPHGSVASQVAYWSHGMGRLGQNSHWLSVASHDTRAWREAKQFCSQDPGGRGCAGVQQIVDLGY